MQTPLKILRIPSPLWLTLGALAAAVLAHIVWRIARSRKIATYVIERTGDAPDPATFQARSSAFVSALPTTGRTASLVASNVDGHLRSYVTFPATRAAAGALDKLAAAVGGRDTHIDEHPDMHDVNWHRKYIVKGNVAGFSGRATAVGANPNGVAETVAGPAFANAWVGVAVRKGTDSEITAWRTAMKAEFEQSSLASAGFGVHQGNTANPAIATIYAGADTLSEARSLASQVVASLPGFDSRVRFVRVNEHRWTVGSALLAAATAVATWHYHVAHFEIIPAIFLIGFALGLLPTEAARISRSVRCGHLPYSLPKRSSSALLAPHLVTQFAAPQAGSSSGGLVVDTSKRVVPKALYAGDHMIGEDPIVPPGADERDNRARRKLYIRDENRYAGVGFIGVPGGGKSVAMRLLFGSDLYWRAQMAKMGRSTKHTVVVFEGQTATVESYIEWCTRLGVPYYVIELATGAGMTVDNFVGRTLKERADNFVSAMRDAMGADVIQFHAGDVLGKIWTLAQAVTPAIAQTAGLRWASPIQYACALADLGAAGLNIDTTAGDDGSDTRLAEAIFAGWAADTSENGIDVRNAYHSTFKKLSAAKRQEAIKSSANKLAALGKTAPWFSAAQKFPWSTIIDSGAVVIVNTGIARDGTPINSEAGNDLAAMLLFQLRQAIEATCGDWQAMGNSIAIYVDELRMFAQHSAESFAWFRQQGRKYGVRLAAALQDVDELDPAVRRIVLGLGTVVWLKQANEDAAAVALSDLGLGGDTWVASEIVNMPIYHGAARVTTDNERHTALVHFPYFETDASGDGFATELLKGIV